MADGKVLASNAVSYSTATTNTMLPASAGNVLRQTNPDTSEIAAVYTVIRAATGLTSSCSLILHGTPVSCTHSPKRGIASFWCGVVCICNVQYICLLKHTGLSLTTGTAVLPAQLSSARMIFTAPKKPHSARKVNKKKARIAWLNAFLTGLESLEEFLVGTPGNVM